MHLTPPSAAMSQGVNKILLFYSKSKPLALMSAIEANYPGDCALDFLALTKCDRIQVAAVEIRNMSFEFLERHQECKEIFGLGSR